MMWAFVAGVGMAVAAGALLAWKWGLGVARSSVVLLGLGSAVAIPVHAVTDAAALPSGVRLALVAGLTLVLAGALVLFRFYRDPERIMPDRDDVVVSPADGEVIYIRRSEGGALPVSTKRGRTYGLRDLVRTSLAEDDAVVVGIALNFLDVHVTRAPIAGEVTAAEIHAGSFRSLRIPEMAFENERATILVQARAMQVATVLIASRLVRQIVTYVSRGQAVAIGQRIGVIRFGSQVDLVLPDLPELEMLIGQGDRVRAGETVVAVLRPPVGGSEPESAAVARAASQEE